MPRIHEYSVPPLASDVTLTHPEHMSQRPHDMFLYYARLIGIQSCNFVPS